MNTRSKKLNVVIGIMLAVFVSSSAVNWFMFGGKSQLLTTFTLLLAFTFMVVRLSRKMPN